MRTLKLAAWTVFAADALVGGSVACRWPVRLNERARTRLGVIFGAIPLVMLFLILFLGGQRDNRVGLSICLALGPGPLILLLDLVARRNFL